MRMGLFSKLFASEQRYDLSVLSALESQNVINFFRNGWADRIRHDYLGGSSGWDGFLDMDVVNDLKRQSISESNLKYLIAILEADYQHNGHDKDEKVIIDKLQCLLD